MANNKILILIFYCLIYLVSCRFFQCQENSEPPKTLSESTIETVDFYGTPLKPVIISNKLLVNPNNNYVESIKGYYTDALYCPKNYLILKKEDFDDIISYLGENVISTLKNTDGLGLSDDIYYLTNTKGNGENNKIFMIIKDNEIKFEDFDPLPYTIDKSSQQKFITICKLNIPQVEIVFPDNKKDFDYNTNLELKTSSVEYFSDYVWKINDKTYTDSTVTLTLNEVGVNDVEFWGKYITGQTLYLCDIFYVSNEKITSEVEYDDTKVKKIKTEFKMHYNNTLHFTHSNCPVATRDDGGYYIAVSNQEKYLHILSFDKDDFLIKDFDTKEKAKPHDITTTYLGFAVYVVDADNIHHSYLLAYDKEFNLVKTVIIMNNENTKENQRIDATPDKQLIRYNKNGKPEFGIRFIYQADNAKLVYSRGRIFLIFAHYNVFDDDWVGHNADTVATFSDDLGDIDFGIVWGASHSLIQSATFDENYFWSATLSDAYPQGIRVEYTSKREFLNNYDAVAKKNNIRVNGQDDSLAGIIKGYYYGWADGKLGAILYFDKLELYCLVYAKTPNHSSDEKNNKNIIYITTWKFTNGKIEQTTFKEIKVLEKGNIMQIRAGKLGDNEVFITYLHTNSSGHNYYGNIPRGSSPKVFVVKLPNFELIKNDEIIGKILMNTNEDLRTFRDGVLIWATSDSDNYLVINKIGVEPAPSVIWKDAYGLETEKKTKDGKDINSAKIKLRGITSDQITDAHSFFIYLIFRLISGIRLLEGEESSDIKIQATCKISSKEGSDINLVDYECVGDTEQDLSNLNLVNIEEGDSDNSLKTSNLNTLIEEIKTNSNDVDLTKGSSTFTLVNTAIFKMNEVISKLQATDFKFSFKIEGTIDKSLTLEGNSINIEFELREADAKANCILEIGESNKASLSCELNVEEYTNINEFSFKTSEFKQDSNEIYFSKLNEIALINSDNMIYPNENNNNNNKEDDDGNKTVIIVVSVICSVIGAAGIGIGLYFILKKLKAKKINYTAKETMGQQTVKTEEIVGSENRVIKYSN